MALAGYMEGSSIPWMETHANPELERVKTIKNISLLLQANAIIEQRKTEHLSLIASILKIVRYQNICITLFEAK